ncbi:hypothetical protein WMY93_023003 [Mugilogobius chulae]|uniref:P-type ATPase C-terminal domain-containing protein n=1 Tax=Mugilogobius chulae TaxID=88201 RepID=A0AAW0ND26_9GOBI
MQNCGKTTFKRTSIDKLMNTLVLWIFGFLLCMGVILAIGNTVWESWTGKHFQEFLPGDDSHTNAVFSGFLTFWSYIIILNTVVPISLYVSVEVLRLGHSHFINWDCKMYFGGTNTPAERAAKRITTPLNIVITFHKKKTACVDFSFNPLRDTKFKFYDGNLVEAVKQADPIVQEFFRLLSLCHTVMPEEKSEGNLVYQAQSPDEGALVTAARNFGFVFRARTPETITVFEMGQSVTYQLLAILDFNNVRKRMSVIVRNPLGQIKLYCKGADTIIFERLDVSNLELMDITSEHLSEFAGEGLRTLALAYKDIDEDYFDVWMKKYDYVSTSMESRDDQLAALYEEIELDLKLLGATAIEDKLQDGVPETIACLNLADIKIWVLTGDKLETAMNIGYSCNMLRDDMNEVSSFQETHCWKCNNSSTAHIGVGISGQEGMQAVLSSDYSFAQFRYLQRLLLVHGRWSYFRMCNFLRYFFYKNFAFTLVHFWYGFFCGFSAQTVYDQWFITLFNIVFTSLPVIAMGLFDQDVNDRNSLRYPSLYKPGQMNLFFNKQDGSNLSDQQAFAVTIATSLVIVVNVQIGLDTHYWTAINHLFIWGSVAMYFALQFALQSNGVFGVFTSYFPFVGTSRNTLSKLNVWLVILLTTVVCVVPGLVVSFLELTCSPHKQTRFVTCS